MVGLTRSYGQWPTEAFKNLAEEKQQEFFQECLSKGIKLARVKHDELLRTFEKHTTFYAESGKFLPLAVWARKGFDEERIKAEAGQGDIRYNVPQLGDCYRVSILCTGEAGERGQARDSVMQCRSKVKRAKLAGEPAGSVAARAAPAPGDEALAMPSMPDPSLEEHPEDDRVSDSLSCSSSTSSSSSSTSGADRKKTKKQKKQKKKNKKAKKAAKKLQKKKKQAAQAAKQEKMQKKAEEKAAQKAAAADAKRAEASQKVAASVGPKLTLMKGRLDTLAACRHFEIMPDVVRTSFLKHQRQINEAVQAVQQVVDGRAQLIMINGCSADGKDLAKLIKAAGNSLTATAGAVSAVQKTVG